MDITFATISVATVIFILLVVGICFLFSTKLPEETEQTKDYKNSPLNPFPFTEEEEGDTNDENNNDESN